MSRLPVEVAVASDAEYLPHTAALLRSLLDSQTGTDVHVHLLHEAEVAAGDLARLGAMMDAGGARLTTHPVSAQSVAGLPAWGRIPVTMWHRIMLPSLLADSARVLYLDVDVLVRDSLQDLFALDLDGCYVAAVTNVPQRHMFGHAGQLGLPGPEHYFNSGVLLMNLDLMRRDGCTDALLRCARGRAGELLWPDQDALNLVLSRRRRRLHPRWNLMNSIRRFEWSDELLDAREVAEARADPGIVHFEGPDENKPWHILCDNPFREVYFSCRRRTPWPHVRRAGVTPANVIALGRRRVASGAAALTGGQG